MPMDMVGLVNVFTIRESVKVLACLMEKGASVSGT